MRNFDPSSLYRSTIGFDRLFSLIDQIGGSDSSPAYPPYNIERLDENNYRITVAVAGFGDDELNIELKENTLAVRGEKKPQIENEKREILHQGIAARSFERRFQLADYVLVDGARLENGLHIDLVREIPEAKKPRTIPIAAARSSSTVLESPTQQ